MRQLIQTTVLAALLAVSSIAGAAPTPAPAPAPAKPATKAIADKELGLSRTSVFEIPSPPAWKGDDSAPGATPLPRRVSTEVPPVIPHGIADFLPITATQNTCLDCHGVPPPKKKGEATPLPASHYLDERRQPAKKGDKVAGARYVCVSCHVGRTDAPPLTGNGFKP